MRPSAIKKYSGKELKDVNYRVKQLKYLITGTGRCGTVYMAKLLTSVGYPCTHEAIFSYDGLESSIKRIEGIEKIDVSDISKLASMPDERKGVLWFEGRKEVEVVAEASYLAAPFINHPILDDTIIIHVVRKPIDVINSFVQGFGYFNDWCLTKPFYKEYHEFIYSHVPKLNNKMSATCKAALYYIEWNRMIEKSSVGKRYYRHRIESPVNKLLSFLGVNTNEFYKNVKSNHKQISPRLTLKDVEIPEIRQELINIEKKYYKISQL